MALVTAAEYKAYLGTSGTDYDSRIDVAIAAVESKVRRMCNRDETNGFEAAERTHVMSGDGTEKLYLPEWPVQSIASVKMRTSALAGMPVFGETLEGSSYVASQRGVLTRTTWNGWEGETNEQWPEGTENIQATYTAGYATIPNDLKLACFILIDAWFAAAGRGDITLNQTTRGVDNRAFATQDEVAMRVSALLAPWRRGFAS